MTGDHSTTGDAVSYFDQLAPAYEHFSATGANFRARAELFERLMRQARDDAPTNVCVDLGCGNGELTMRAEDLGFRALGLDGSAEMLRLASAKGKLGGPTFRCERLPLSDYVLDELSSSAGLVIASSVVEYLDDDARFIEQCASLLAPGGRALVSFPNARSPWRLYERLLGDRGPLRGSIVRVQRRQYRLVEVMGLAKEAGLTVEAIHYFRTTVSAPPRKTPVLDL